MLRLPFYASSLTGEIVNLLKSGQLEDKSRLLETLGHFGEPIQDGVSPPVAPSGEKCTMGVCYEPYILPSGSRLPARLGKSAKALKGLSLSGVRCTHVVIDVDRRNPDGTKKRWDKSKVAREMELEIAQFTSADLTPTFWHTTDHGYHAWFELSHPVTPSDQETISDAVRGMLQAAGVDVDTTCSDWTRVMSLPNPFSSPYEQGGSDETFDPSLFVAELAELGEPEWPSEGFQPLELSEAEWGPEVVEAAFEGGVVGKLTPLGKHVRRFLKSKLQMAIPGSMGLVEALYHQKPLKPGARDDTVSKTTGHLARMLRDWWHKQDGIEEVELLEGMMGFLAVTCFATDQASGPQDNGESWFAKAQLKFMEHWETDADDARVEFEATTSRILEARSKAEIQPELGFELPPVVMVGKDYHALNPDLSTYTIKLVSLDMAKAVLKIHGILEDYEFTYLDEKDKEQPLKEGTLVERGVIGIGDPRIGSTVKKPGQSPGGYLVPDPVKSEGSSHIYFDELTTEIKHVEPVWSQTASEHLKVLAKSQEQYQALKAFLHFYPDFNLKLPMLIVTGETRSGKSVLGKALAEFCTAISPRPMDNSGFSRFGDGILVKYDETYPCRLSSPDALLNGSSTLLSMLMHEHLEQNKKSRQEVEVSQPWRVVHIKNDERFVNALSDVYSRVEDDKTWEALSLRMLRIHTHNASGHYISKMGEVRKGVTEDQLVSEMAGHIAWLAAQPHDDFMGAVRTIEPSGFIQFNLSRNSHQREANNDMLSMLDILEREITKSDSMGMSNKFLTPAIHVGGKVLSVKRQALRRYCENKISNGSSQAMMDRFNDNFARLCESSARKQVSGQIRDARIRAYPCKMVEGQPLVRNGEDRLKVSCCVNLDSLRACLERAGGEEFPSLEAFLAAEVVMD